jgi:hypothetical protein
MNEPTKVAVPTEGAGAGVNAVGIMAIGYLFNFVRR